MKRIPFVPLPLEKARQRSKPLLGISSWLIKFFPGLESRLIQAEIDLKAREYLSVALFSSLFWFLLLFPLFSLLLIKTPNFIFISFSLSFVIAFLSFFYINLYPNLIIIRKVKDIDKNLPYALRHLLIQVKSGVSLIDAMASVAKADYGLISKEFDSCVKEIATGEEVKKALEKIAFRNPSLYFRRIIWQIVNSMRAGVDIGDILLSLVESVTSEQRVAIRRYGAQLTPFALLYLMFAVIFPTLGVVALVILSGIGGLGISEPIFYGIAGALVLFQFMAIGLVKGRMPPVEL